MLLLSALRDKIFFRKNARNIKHTNDPAPLDLTSTTQPALTSPKNTPPSCRFCLRRAQQVRGPLVSESPGRDSPPSFRPAHLQESDEILPFRRLLQPREYHLRALDVLLGGEEVVEEGVVVPDHAGGLVCGGVRVALQERVRREKEVSSDVFND